MVIELIFIDFMNLLSKFSIVGYKILLYRQEIVNVDFTTQDIIVLIGSAVVGVWYFMKKHWIANNLFGLAFAVNGVELLHLNKVITGCILLGGLFFYDIFWVFGTNVMVTVAKSFEAPIKLVFPQDLLENGLAAQVENLQKLSSMICFYISYT